MNADVAFAPELFIPDWVPESVAKFARTKYAREVHETYAGAIFHFDPAIRDELAARDEVRARMAGASVRI
jgi:hypothetical protein